jgi:hypothetical protein
MRGYVILLQLAHIEKLLFTREISEVYVVQNPLLLTDETMRQLTMSWKGFLHNINREFYVQLKFNIWVVSTFHVGLKLCVDSNGRQGMSEL